jgi:hypothetical protein
MHTMTRRTFLELSAGAFGASMFGGRAPAQTADPARIYTVFFDIAPSRDDTTLVPIPNEDIIRRLQSDCGGVEFVVRDLTKGVRLESVLNEAKDLRQSNYDGVVICGWPRDYDLLRTGLPTIDVAVVNDFQNIPYPLFRQNRVIDAALDPWGFSEDPDVSERMFRDLADKIKLIRMLKRMKKEHILTVTDSKYVNVTYGDGLKNPPADYNERILDAINSAFGTRVTKIGSREVTGNGEIRSLWYGGSGEADEIARRWINNAQKMINTTESEVVRSAKLFLALKMLMQKYEATAMAFHIRTLIPDPRPQDMVFPALATSEFQLDNRVVKCQSHLNIILSEMLLQYAYGRPSMLGDFSVDTYNNTSVVQHCEGPWNPWGDARRVPYVLTDHRERGVRARSMPGVGAASWILYPPGEAVTMWQIDVLSREALMHTGPTVPMLTEDKRYKDHFYEMM